MKRNLDKKTFLFHIVCIKNSHSVCSVVQTCLPFEQSKSCVGAWEWALITKG